MKTEVLGREVRVTFPFDRWTVQQVNQKGLGMTLDGPSKSWRHPLTERFAREFTQIFPDQIEAFLPHYPNLPQPKNQDIVQPAAGAAPRLPEEYLNGWTPPGYLMHHQRQNLLRASAETHWAFFDDTGTGKTLVGLNLVAMTGLKTLVLCPLTLIENAWMDDLLKWTPQIQYVNLWDAKRRLKLKTKRDQALEEIQQAQVGFLNFESFASLLRQLPEWGFRMLLVDESSALKNPQTQITKNVIKLADTMDRVYLFSGTPAPNGEEEYWGQVRALNWRVLGKSYYAFRTKYFFSAGYGGFDWKMKPQMYPEFLAKLASISSTVRKEDVLDLPERTFQHRKVDLIGGELAAYREMENTLMFELGDDLVLAASEISKLMKLREGTSGFFYDQEKKVIPTGDTKLRELMTLLEEIGQHQVLIWTHFNPEADAICKALREAGKTYARVDGTVSHALKNEGIQAFKTGQVQYLIGRPQSIGHGHTLVNCTYMVYYSLSHSYEQYYQANDRIYRKGQRNACTYYHLIARGTVDEAILQALHHKGSAAQAVYDYLRGKPFVPKPEKRLPDNAELAYQAVDDALAAFTLDDK